MTGRAKNIRDNITEFRFARAAASGYRERMSEPRAPSPEKAAQEVASKPSGTADNLVSFAEARAARRKIAGSSPSAKTGDEGEGHNPWAVALGAAVVLGLVIGAWLLIDSMKCNPLFSDAGLYHSRACRDAP